MTDIRERITRLANNHHCMDCQDAAITMDKMMAENERLEKWVNDLQAGMYINCVYCGHNYGPDNEVPATMADILKEHIEQCPEHPMSKLTVEKEKMQAVVEAATELKDNMNNDLGVLIDKIAALEQE